MTIITPTSISGITSIRSSQNDLSLYKSDGTALTVLNTNINSTGVSTITTLNATTIAGVTTAGITTAYIGAINDGPISGARNRIINGDMRIDQRNAGVSTTVGSGACTLDRWSSSENTDGVATIIRSGTAPVGFTSSLLWTTTTADTSLGVSQSAYIQQAIEGYNISDLAWGTSSAKSVTLSFWVRSSLTGTFSGGIQNGAGNRAYPFTYTISSANTFEYKTITIPGDTTGTWLTDNTIGMWVVFSMGAGSGYLGTANTWQAGNVWAVAGETPVIGTLNATWYVTGVQLEAGPVATPFERRSYGQELALCQRYCWGYGYSDTATFGTGYEGSTGGRCTTITPVLMRAAPTLATSSAASTFTLEDASSAKTVTSIALSYSSPNSVTVTFNATGAVSNTPCIARTNSASSFIIFSAEL